MKENPKPKVLVAGGAGFIGSHVVDMFIAKGYDTVVVDNLSKGSISNINPRATFYKADLRDRDLAEIFRVERPDFVNHLATMPGNSFRGEEPLTSANAAILGSINLIQLAIKAGIKHFTYISSAEAIYGRPIYLPCDESHPVAPITPMGVFMHTIELFLDMCYWNYNLNYTVLRYPTVYGPRQKPNNQSGIIAALISQLLTNKPTVFPRDGEKEIDIVHVDDCVKANLIVLEKGISRNIYNLGTGVGTSIFTIYTALKDITNSSRGLLFVPVEAPETPAEQVLRIFFDAKKARQELGWYPQVDLLEGLRTTVTPFVQVEMVS